MPNSSSFRSYATFSCLYHHIDAVHGGNKERITCKICLKVFTNPSGLTRHMQIHSNQKRYKCSICGRRFTDQSTHQKHLVIHTGTQTSDMAFFEFSFSIHRHIRPFSKLEEFTAHCRNFSTLQSHLPNWSTCARGYGIKSQHRKGIFFNFQKFLLPAAICQKYLV